MKTTKSPRRVLRYAYLIGQLVLPDYSHRCSRRNRPPEGAALHDLSEGGSPTARQPSRTSVSRQDGSPGPGARLTAPACLAGGFGRHQAGVATRQSALPQTQRSDRKNRLKGRFRRFPKAGVLSLIPPLIGRPTKKPPLLESMPRNPVACDHTKHHDPQTTAGFLQSSSPGRLLSSDASGVAS